MPSDRPHSIEELYSMALALPIDQRTGFIAAHCPDATIRQELLRRLSDATQTVEAAGAHARKARSTAPDLPAGTRLGHYRIQGALGSGGMGHVYEALDEDLNRTVAIKVLPPGSYDEVSRKRFRREAEAASALNHPNIVTVYEVGREGDIDFIAMERITGKTVHNLIGGKPMRVRKAVEIASQIAAALAAAHEAGIVHRDLKPANVMVNDRGIVKVLDFGLAKQFFTAGMTTGAADGSVEVSRLGEVAGTAYYMSPEQAEGRSVDARSDIFAFGSVLYEMLTGRRAFQRETVISTLHAITAAEPEPLRAVRPELPRLLESIVEKCTRKQPYERWQSLSDVKLILQDLAADGDAADTLRGIPAIPAAPSSIPMRYRWLSYALAGAAAGAALTFGIQRALRPAAAEPTALPILRLVTAEKGLSASPALSPDGSLLAFASDRANQGNLDIWIQQVGGSEPMRLTSDSADESDPAFSPDGARLAFRSEKEGGGIYLVAALGGDPVLIGPQGRNPRFSPDGKSLAYWVGVAGSLVPGSSKPYIVDFAGGQPRVLETGIVWAQYPIWSPDGSSLLVYGMSGNVADPSKTDWWIVPPAGGKAKPLGVRSKMAPQGRRIAFPLAQDWFGWDDSPQVLFAAEAGDNANLWRMGLTADGRALGSPVRVTNGPGRHVSASWIKTKEGSTRLAYQDETNNYDVWRLPIHPATGLATGPMQAVTDRLTPEMYPTVSGDGKQVYFITKRLGTSSIVRKDLDTNRERVLFSSPDYLYNSRVASQGSRLFFAKPIPELIAIPAAGGVTEPLCNRCGSLTGVSPRGDRVLIEPSHDDHLMMFDAASGKLIKLADRGSPHILLSGGQFSPDGNWVAFGASNSETRMSEVFVIPISGALPVPRAQWISISGESGMSHDPVFAPAGPFLYFPSEIDGFRCLWARRLHPVTRVPAGDAFPVQHLHSARLGIRKRAQTGNITGLGAGGNHLVFALTETTGTIWLEETKSGQ